MRRFSKLEIAAIKRTAQNVAQFTTKKSKIDEKIAELEAEKAALQPMIDAFQGPIKEMTGGYTTEDLIIRETVKTGKLDPKSGKEVFQTRFVLRYPDTVVPVEEHEESVEEAKEDAIKVLAEEPAADFTVNAPADNVFDWQ